MMKTTFCQLMASGESYRIAEINHWWRCSALICDGRSERFKGSLRTAQEISSYSGIVSYTKKGRSLTGIDYTGGGMFR